MSTMQFRPKVLQPVHVPTPSPSSTNSGLSSGSSNPLPPHEKGNTFFSPRPNDQYTPLEKIDATPGSGDSISPFNYALQHQQQLQQQQQQQFANQHQHQHFNPGQMQQPQYYSSPSNFSSPSNAYSSPSNSFSSPSNAGTPPYNTSHQQIHHTSLSRRPQHLDEHSQPFNAQSQQMHHPQQQQHFDQFNSHQGMMHHSHQQQSHHNHSHGGTGESNLTQRTPNAMYPSSGHAHAHTDAFSLDSTHAGDDDENDHDHGRSKSSPSSSVLGVMGFDSSMSAATFNLCNVILGSGIVSLPAAVEQAGVVAAFFILILQAIITRYSLGLLIQSGLKLKVFDYEELLRTAFGKGGWMVGLISIFLLDFGVMLTFLIVVVDTFSPILAFYLGSDDSIFLDRTFTLCFVSFLAILPLSLFRSLKSLAWVSMASVGAVIAIVLLVCWKLMFGDIPSSTVSSPSSSGSLFTILGSNFLSAFGSMSFVYTCHDSSFAIFQSVRHPNLPKWKSIVSAAVGIALVPMLVLAYAGYFAFASSGLQSNVLNNFPRGDHLVNVARFALGASTVMTYPLNLFMCRHVIAKVSGLHSSDRLTQQQHSVITLGLFLASLFIASSLRNLGVVQSLVGGIAGSMLAFILPAVAALKSRQITEGRPFVHPENGPTLALLALGVVIMLASTLQTLFFD